MASMRYHCWHILEGNTQGGHQQFLSPHPCWPIYVDRCSWQRSTQPRLSAKSRSGRPGPHRKWLPYWDDSSCHNLGRNREIHSHENPRWAAPRVANSWVGPALLLARRRRLHQIWASGYVGEACFCARRLLHEAEPLWGFHHCHLVWFPISLYMSF